MSEIERNCRKDQQEEQQVRIVQLVFSETTKITQYITDYILKCFCQCSLKLFIAFYITHFLPNETKSCNNRFNVLPHHQAPPTG